jgi:hypothetical protein
MPNSQSSRLKAPKAVSKRPRRSNVSRLMDMLPLSMSTKVGAAISRFARKWSSHQSAAA